MASATSTRQTYHEDAGRNQPPRAGAGRDAPLRFGPERPVCCCHDDGGEGQDPEVAMRRGNRPDDGPDPERQGEEGQRAGQKVERRVGLWGCACGKQGDVDSACQSAPHIRICPPPPHTHTIQLAGTGHGVSGVGTPPRALHHGAAAGLDTLTGQCAFMNGRTPLSPFPALLPHLLGRGEADPSACRDHEEREGNEGQRGAQNDQRWLPWRERHRLPELSDLGCKR